MKSVHLSVIVIAAACSLLLAAQPTALAAPVAAQLLSPDEAKEINAVIAAMMTAGFPNAEKATVYSGTVSVSAAYDPTQTAPPLPTSASRSQMTIPNSNKVTYGFAFEGLHFKLRDGSWIISTAYRFKPGPGDKVNAAEAVEVNLATLTADALAAHPFDVEKAAKYFARVAPEHRERSKALLGRLEPVRIFLKLHPDNVAPAAVLLHQAGWVDAGELSLLVSEQRASNYWQLRPWMRGESAFDPTGTYPKADEEVAAWRTAHPQITPEAPQVALRRAMFRWCRAQMMVEEPEDALLPLLIAAATTKAAIDPKDPQNNAARVDAMLAGAKLPVSPAQGATLVARLQSWEARVRMPRMTVMGGGGARSPQISTSFLAPAPAYIPAKTDLDALVQLLADDRPSRFNDFSGPRTVGDNAWRALTVLLNSDPRTLAGYPTDRPWTANERTSAANAVQVWWKNHRGEYVEK